MYNTALVNSHNCIINYY